MKSSQTGTKTSLCRIATTKGVQKNLPIRHTHRPAAENLGLKIMSGLDWAGKTQILSVFNLIQRIPFLQTFQRVGSYCLPDLHFLRWAPLYSIALERQWWDGSSIQNNKHSQCPGGSRGLNSQPAISTCVE